MSDWDFTVEELTPELEANFKSRAPRESTRKIQEAVGKLKRPNDVVSLEIPVGQQPQAARSRIRNVAKGLGIYVDVYVMGDLAKVKLGTPPPPRAEGAKPPGRPKREAS